MRRIRRPSHATVVAYISLFVALTGGTAAALDGSNTVFTDDITDNGVPASGGNPAGGLVAADLRANSVGSSEITNDSVSSGEVTNESLFGPDINEGTLDVDSGTRVSSTACAPNSPTFVSCGSGAVTFGGHGSGESEALVLITVEWSADVSGAAGNCRLLVNDVVQSESTFAIGETTDTTNATHPGYAARPFSVQGNDGQTRSIAVQCNETEQDLVIHKVALAVTGDLQE